MKHAIVAIEDKRFYQHSGVDLRGIGRAVWADMSSKGVVQGGSTITQQFVKNSCVTLEADDQPQAQGGGARLAARAALVEGADPHRLPEHDLLRERRLRHPAGGADVLQHDGLTADAPQAALLAGIPADPIRYDPVTNPKTSRARRRSSSRRCSTSTRSRAPTSAAPTRAPLPSRRTCTCPASRARRRTSSTTSSSS